MCDVCLPVLNKYHQTSSAGGKHQHNAGMTTADKQDSFSRKCVGINDLACVFFFLSSFIWNACHTINTLLAVPHKPPPVMADLLTEMPNQSSNGSMWRCSSGLSYILVQSVILMGLGAVAVKPLADSWLRRHHSCVSLRWHTPYINFAAWGLSL